MSVHTAAASCARRPLSTLAARRCTGRTPLSRHARRRRYPLCRTHTARTDCASAPPSRAAAAGTALDPSKPLASLRRRSRCARNHYYWIHPSDLRSSINACPTLPADPLGGAAVHWRQRSPSTSRTRDRQSSYNPQLRCTCARSSRRSAISRLPLVAGVCCSPRSRLEYGAGHPVPPTNVSHLSCRAYESRTQSRFIGV